MLKLLLILLLTTCPVLAQDEPTSQRVLGLARVDHKWALIRKVLPVRRTTFLYTVEGSSELKVWTKKLRGVPDLRKYADRYPIRFWIQETCHRWQPVLNAGASVALPAVQAYTNSRGR